MSNKRIDLTQLENQYKKEIEHNSFHAPDSDKDDNLFVIGELIAELKRCYEEIDALRSITQDWVKIETFSDDGKDLSVNMEDSDGNCFSGYINRASE